MNEYVLIDKTKLTSIADKVRSISGATETMSALDIDNKLDTEISDVKEIITTWLTDNEVEVSGATNMSDLVGLVKNVEVKKELTTVSGTITPASETNAITIEHNLGKIPQYFLLIRANGIYSQGSALDAVKTPATAAQTVLSVILAGNKLFYVKPWYSAGYNAKIAYCGEADFNQQSNFFNSITTNESIISIEMIEPTSVFRTKTYAWEVMG